ncbi:limonene-1,2-epoxide hydrolase family protein [Acidovorax sp. Leaf73]|uniref:limonene-1,2-epoxide hydrolase family protein n=1 Tax=Acidovorax sp. Leaf73 TaxID=2876566 RepID=UPI001E4254D6|nr:limonene-1,2-epoxide hydrolase family protein [Acidovorax sp. Leaf73]
MKYALAIAAVLLSTCAWSQTCDTFSKAKGKKNPTPLETVTAFSAAFSVDNGKAAIRRWFTHRTVWVNEGVSITTGIEEAIAFLERPGRSPDIAAVHFDMLAIAADGNLVLTERLDRFVRSDGSAIVAVKVMGIFEVEGDCIVAWRDYFDVNFAKKISKDHR